MILDRILDRARADLAIRKGRLPFGALERCARAAPPPRGFGAALRRGGGLAFIAELKRRSPSAGWIRKGADAAAIARDYLAAGAAALSVLTDEPFFGGSLDDLRRAREAIGAPLLRKDFVIDPYQVWEARAFGADAILLIVAALDSARLAELVAAADDAGLDALVEAHDEGEIDRALRAGAGIVGVNQRDLQTFAVDRGLAARLRSRIPAGCLAVAESGVGSPDDLRALRTAGVDAVLLGEALMRADRPGEALASLRAQP